MVRLHKPLVGLDSKGVKIKQIAERHLLYDLNEFMARSEERNLEVALSGGLAVRAYIGPLRFTSDADLIVSKAHFGAARKILKEIGYSGRQQDFGKGKILFANKYVSDSKKGVNYKLEFDLSIDGLFDASSSNSISFTERMLNETRKLPVWGYFNTSSSLLVTAKVLSLEDLFLMKTITKDTRSNGREKDTMDALLLALKNPPDLVRIWKVANEQGIERHFKSQLSDKLIACIEGDIDSASAKYGMGVFSDEEKRRIRGVLTSVLISGPLK